MPLPALPYPGSVDFAIDFLFPRSPRTLIGDVTITVHRHIRFTDSSPGEQVIYQLANELTLARWKMNRIGGCGAATFVLHDTDIYNSRTLKKFALPDPVLLQEDELYGGVIMVWVRLFDTVGPVTDPRASQVYMGRIKDIGYSAMRREVTIKAEGLSAALDDIYLNTDWTDTSLRDILDAIVDPLIKGNTASGLDGPLRGKNIYGAGSLLDFVAPEVQAVGESASNVLRRIFQFLPGRYVWGVDRLGYFYFQPQDEVYDDSGTALLPVDTFFIKEHADKWERTYKVANRYNIVTAYGTELTDGSARITGSAYNQRDILYYGPKTTVVKESDVPTSDLAAKLAQAVGRENSIQSMTARLDVVEDIQTQKAFRQALVPFASPVVVNEHGQVSSSVSTGDANALQLDGTTGEVVQIPNDVNTYVSNNWAFHIAITFDAAPEVAGTNFLFGRMNSNMATDGLYGWGFLTWDGTTGGIQFRYTDGSGVNQSFFTNITVPIAGPFPITKYITVARNKSGSWNVFDSLTRVRTVGSTDTQNQVTANSPWRGFAGYFAPYGRHRGKLQNFWFYRTENLSNQSKSGYTSWLTAISTLLSVTVNSRFPINWRGNYTGTTSVAGLVMWCELVEDQSTVTPTSWPVVRKGYDGSIAYGVLLRIASVAAASTVNGSFTGRQWNSGLRWGGPIVLNWESVEYEVNPRLSKVRKSFQLGSKSLSLDNIVSSIAGRLKRLEELDRKTAEARS